MFQSVELSWQKESLALDTHAEEFTIASNFNPVDLLIYQLLKQLKINSLLTVYSFRKTAPVLLVNMPSAVEWIDETPRFKFAQQDLMNLKELFLIQKLQGVIGEETCLDIGVEWGKKQTLIFDLKTVECMGNIQETYIKRYSNTLINTLSDGNLLVLNERFKILLNAPFLNRLKTYYLFWVKKHHLNYGVPSWYEKLYAQ
ncbi:hypothetical protein DNU06_07230 [Putridiphycobacter roseus]|uniref:Uncharacterized protein n=1 Tax=Putridiphycobacter roseus TaxID=2219161 RepID=A0A2W1N1E7_9FLAO|nr:hypothetical protein [Putridiphycobacter roseus]PZE17614.1 hypothetical protein DNU06_07230 [Putridiphycobacter roseus]